MSALQLESEVAWFLGLRTMVVFFFSQICADAHVLTLPRHDLLLPHHAGDHSIQLWGKHPEAKWPAQHAAWAREKQVRMI